ncbi:hypothetical protein B0H16DRAFT_378208 [Mycena metata]|uniref:F-box domain-containing protein n=1 Tax=Mycena metata TaxID=1033252 RepID=A0AAD7HHV7_9AGAR|nr:hypothetical protein B0H16DRAFT_378208 [Mycena metata]
MASPFTSRLGTNYCPQDEEIAQILALTAGPSLRLEALEDEISNLQHALQKLVEEREKLATYIDAHKALLSPARRLPHDVIEEIFMACLPTHRNCVMSATEAPILLGRICSAWRDLSLSTPRLWASLHIVEPIMHDGAPWSPVLDQKAALRLATTKTWLGRSGQCTLSLSLLSGADYRDQSSIGGPTLFLDALVPFASRWEHISFVGPSSSVVPALSHLTAAHVPTLKSLAIRDLHEGDSVGWESLGIIQAPAISSFKFFGENIPALEISLHWNHLAELEIKESAMTGDIALQVLSRCPQLRTCRLSVKYEPDITQRPTAECPFLHTLELDSEDSLSRIMYQIFGRVSFSQLRHLELFGMGDDGDENTGISCNLAAAVPSLETVAMNGDLLVGEHFKDFVRSLPPTIQKFHLNPPIWTNLSGELLSAFIPPPDFPNLCCPNLRELEIQQSCSVPNDVLVAFIRPRVGMLSRLAIHFTARRSQDDALPNIQPFLEAGLQIELTYRPPFSPPRFSSPWDGLAD